MFDELECLSLEAHRVLSPLRLFQKSILVLCLSHSLKTCADPDSFVRGGPALTTFCFLFVSFLVYEGREDPNTTISGPSSARQRNVNSNGFSLACRKWPSIECWHRSLLIFQGIRQVLQETLYLGYFAGWGGGSGPQFSTLDPRMEKTTRSSHSAQYCKYQTY